jgi:hypothetical protein
MKYIIVLTCCGIFLISWWSCTVQPAADNKQAIIDSLTHRINQLKPGLGEYMLQVKYHHDALGNAITAKDYERAGYEIDEIKEVTEKVQELHITNDKLQQPFSVFYQKYLQAPLSILAEAAEKKDAATLKTNFIALTANCNSCHHENNMGFMKINADLTN